MQKNTKTITEKNYIRTRFYRVNTRLIEKRMKTWDKKQKCAVNSVKTHCERLPFDKGNYLVMGVITDEVFSNFIVDKDNNAHNGDHGPWFPRNRCATKESVNG